ncbi:endosome/lysosome-associated apoptosis and autophagy regulator family member 2-like isoform X2 [Daphnia pulicaria]|uniref:endosome/lysosome-associated apoptosis and autophagy regulator family member 2-like isoform X2 n=1 Tax=Daphnia pulicaria TaxID=35523 RepID=UPI001EEB30DC|nr:endosome/lysosome-associated apoptosis and autophagy regulator family member 2-like isoform X2 [Daphnia pulicaria]
MNFVFHQLRPSQLWRLAGKGQTTTRKTTMVGHYSLLLLLLVCIGADADNLPTCQPRDFHYELTECDPTATGGRWRVSVPKAGVCTGGAPNAPVRLQDCSLTCKSGEYFDLELLQCHECPPGTYSLGGMVRHEIWDQLPDGFSVLVEPLTSRSSFSMLERERSYTNCSKSEWQTRGDYIAFPGGSCVATLVYTVRLIQPGALHYTYQYPDDDTIFEFQAQNELCQSVSSGGDEIRWPTVTEEGKWRTSKSVQLPAGLNVLQWKAMGITGRHQTKPLLIKSIEVSGVADPAVSTGCTPCRNGTHAPAPRSRQCQDCPADSYSGRGATQCIRCDAKTSFASPGSGRCHKRPPCTQNDYFEVHSACDERNNTLVTYQWVEPRTCRDDLPSSAKLPSGAERRKCPPCNPGMQMDYTTGTCRFCPPGSISDGIRPCRACPPSTAPNTGLQFIWWSALPGLMSSRCMSLEGYTGTGCTTAAAWLTSGDHLRTGHGHAPDSYLILSLKIEKGFRAGRGTVSFTFQLDCEGDCQFVFMQSSPTKGISVIQTWSGRVPKQHFSYSIPQNGSYTFNWAFQKQAWSEDVGAMLPYSATGVQRLRLFDTDSARIDQVNVTNTIEGGASVCLPCAQGADASGCIPCPPGHYTEAASTHCKPCPANTVVLDPGAVGKSACINCGPGLISTDSKTCTTDCTPTINGTRYDLRKIGSKFHEVRGSLLFTASGMQYFHVFNISLCGREPVNCANNITFQAEGEPKSVKALICRTTLIPSQSVDASGGSSPLSTQSVTLGDHLLGITNEAQFGETRVLDEFYNPKDLHVFFGTPTATKSCPKGRTTTVTLRCDADQPGAGQVTLPSRCPDGTCDGCHFHFLWSSSTVCPICGAQDIKIVKSECVAGEQNVHYLAPKHCLMADDVPGTKKVPCSTEIPFVLQLIIMGCVGTAVLLCLTVFICWKRNRRLEYKYSRLARQRSSTPSNSSGGNDTTSSLKDNGSNECETELAAAESCALDDDEDEEDEVSVTVPMKSFGLVNKIRSMTAYKSESGSPFETIQLTEAQS